MGYRGRPRRVWCGLEARRGAMSRPRDWSGGGWRGGPVLERAAQGRMSEGGRRGNTGVGSAGVARDGRGGSDRGEGAVGGWSDS